MSPLLIWFSAVSFFGFGFGCLIAPSLRREFTRYGLAGQRTLVGILQLAGAAGLLAGLIIPVLGELAAGGLALLMMLGVVVRIRIHDSVIQTLPAFLYMILNGFLCLWAF